jgi:hypothetical protein
MKTQRRIAMGVRPMANALVLTVEQHYDDDEQLCARFEDGSPCIAYIPSSMLFLVGHMAACKLLAEGYDPDRHLLVRLRGADYDLISAPLGCAAAQPLVNYDKPVHEAASIVYRRPSKAA